MGLARLVLSAPGGLFFAVRAIVVLWGNCCTVECFGAVLLSFEQALAVAAQTVVCLYLADDGLYQLV